MSPKSCDHLQKFPVIRKVQVGREGKKIIYTQQGIGDVCPGCERFFPKQAVLA